MNPYRPRGLRNTENTNHHIEEIKPLYRLTSNELLAKVQANIFEPHKRNHVKCLFFHFVEIDAERLKKAISNFADEISSAKDLHNEMKAFKECYREAKKMGINDPYHQCSSGWGQIKSFHLSFKGIIKILGEGHKAIPLDTSFHKGMLHEDEKDFVMDSHAHLSKNWRDHKDLEDRSVDMMVILADNDQERLNSECQKTIKFFKGKASFLFNEKGEILLNQMGKPIEPFGFRDGLSRIPFWTPNKVHLSKKKKNREIVLDKKFGSYLVFRKLEQDKLKFDKAIYDVGEKLSGQKPDANLIQYLEAQLMGRFKDGTPLALYEEPILENGKATLADKLRIDKFNNYEISTAEVNTKVDPQKCPFFAHSIKMNPRDHRKIKRQIEDMAMVEC